MHSWQRIVLFVLPLLIGVAGLAAIGTQPPVAAEAPIAVALVDATTLSILSGRVEVQTAVAPGVWLTAINGQTLAAGDRIKTLEDSHALITYFEGSTTTLDPNTELLIRQLAQDPTGLRTEIDQQVIVGKTWSRVVRLLDPASRFQVETPSAVAVVRGTEFKVDVDENGRSGFQASTGEMAVAPPGQAGAAVPVPAGQETSAQPGQAPEPPRPAPPPPSGLRLTLASPATMYVCDPANRCVGFYDVGGGAGTSVNQIPGAFYSGPASDPQILVLPEPLDNYTIVLNSKDEGGEYHLEVAGLAGNTVATKQTFAGEVKKGDRVQTGTDIKFDAQGRPHVGTIAEPTKVADMPGAVVLARSQLTPLPADPTAASVVRAAYARATTRAQSTVRALGGATPTAAAMAWVPTPKIEEIKLLTMAQAKLTPRPKATPIPTATLQPEAVAALATAGIDPTAAAKAQRGGSLAVVVAAPPPTRTPRPDEPTRTPEPPTPTVRPGEPTPTPAPPGFALQAALVRQVQKAMEQRVARAVVQATLVPPTPTATRVPPTPTRPPPPTSTPEPATPVPPTATRFPTPTVSAPTWTPAPSPTLAATVTPAPTDTPTPTVFPPTATATLPPTLTPLPTRTPRFSPTPSATANLQATVFAGATATAAARAQAATATADAVAGTATAQAERLIVAATATAEARQLALAATATARAERLALAGTATVVAERAAVAATATAQAERLTLAATATAEAERFALAGTATAEAQRIARAATATAQAEELILAATATARAQFRIAAGTATAQAERLALAATATAEVQRLALAATATAQAQLLVAAATATAQAEQLAVAATATAQAQRIALAATATAQAERLALAATATAQAQRVALAATATAQAVAETATAQALAAAATATGQAVAATATAEAQRVALAATATAQALAAAATATGQAAAAASATAVAAHATATAPKKLAVTVNGSGTVSSSPAGISCPGTCSTEFNHGTTVVLAASPATGWVFASWNGCSSVSGTLCFLNMDTNRSVTATFVLPTPTPTATATSIPTVTTTPTSVPTATPTPTPPPTQVPPTVTPTITLTPTVTSTPVPPTPTSITITSTGTNVEVVGGSGETITFASVTGAGSTTVTASSTPPAGVPTPTGVQVIGDYRNIVTTATFSGTVEVCLPFAASAIPTGFSATDLLVLHFDEVSGDWFAPAVQTLDTSAGRACTEVTSLSPFILTVPVPTGTIPAMFVAPASIRATQGQVVVAKVRLATGDVMITGVEFTLHFDPGVLQAVDDPAVSGCDGLAPGPEMRQLIVQTCDNSTGRIHFAAGSIALSNAGATGAGEAGNLVVATITFQAASTPGTTALTLVNVGREPTLATVAGGLDVLASREGASVTVVSAAG